MPRNSIVHSQLLLQDAKLWTQHGPPSGHLVAAGHRHLGPEYKLKQNVRIAMLYLEDDDAVNAEAYIKKASSLIASNKVRLRPRHLVWPVNSAAASLLLLSRVHLTMHGHLRTWKFAPAMRASGDSYQEHGRYQCRSLGRSCSTRRGRKRMV